MCRVSHPRLFLLFLRWEWQSVVEPLDNQRPAQGSNWWTVFHFIYMTLLLEQLVIVVEPSKMTRNNYQVEDETQGYFEEATGARIMVM